jgi:hypothetical protein
MSGTATLANLIGGLNILMEEGKTDAFGTCDL